MLTLTYMFLFTIYHLPSTPIYLCKETSTVQKFAWWIILSTAVALTLSCVINDLN